MPEPLSAPSNGSVLVRVAPEILEKMKTGDVEPVVILGVQEQDDGTHDMTLMTPDVVAENRRLREALVQCATISGADVSDGPPTWPSVDVWAVQEVTQLRQDYDEALKELSP